MLECVAASREGGLLLLAWYRLIFISLVQNGLVLSQT